MNWKCYSGRPSSPVGAAHILANIRESGVFRLNFQDGSTVLTGQMEADAAPLTSEYTGWTYSG
jgi:hypothetical protein